MNKLMQAPPRRKSSARGDSPVRLSAKLDGARPSAVSLRKTVLSPRASRGSSNLKIANGGRWKMGVGVDGKWEWG